jgi:plasmid stabilization system protein ParE
MRVRYTARSRADLAEIVAYISRGDPAAAKRVQRAIFDAIDLVAAYPYAGIRNARSPELRSKLVSRYPYRVHYRLKGQELWIIHIRHTARRFWDSDVAP